MTAYFTERPDPAVPAERVAFGTSGHRGSSFKRAFNEAHILAITQAICLYRAQHRITGPLFLGIDTHALSVPAGATALEVLAANGVDVMIAADDEYTPTPVISHAILTYNRDRTTGLADGIVVTPSHNPPHDGGFKYNPPTGGPADTDTTRWIEAKANELLEARLAGVKRIPYERALRAPTTHRHDYRHCVRGGPGGRRRPGRPPGRTAPPGRGPPRRCRRALLGAHRRAPRSRPHRRRRHGRPDVPVHDRWIGTARSAWIPRRRTPWPGSSA